MAAHASKYQLLIAVDSVFKSIEFMSPQIPDTMFGGIPNLNVGAHFWKVKAIGDNQDSIYSEVRSFHWNGIAGVNNEANFENFHLSNYPNPFSSKTTISYSLNDAGIVSLKIFDLLGQELQSLESGYKEPGNHSLIFDRNLISDGMYIIRFEVNRKTASHIVHLVK